MRNIWARIGLGVLGVFLAGMLLVSVGREVKQAVAQAVRTSITDRVGSQQANVGHTEREFPFRLDGERLGTVARLDLRRSAKGTPMSALVSVRLESPGAAERLVGCDLVPEGADDLGLDEGFRCADQGERNLTNVGTVQFDPGGIVRPLLAQRNQLDELKRGDPMNLSLDLSSGVNLQGKGDHAQFNLFADSGGAVISVDGLDGQPLVRLLADSSGAFIKIRDKNGRQLFRLNAGKHGVSLRGDKVEGN